MFNKSPALSCVCSLQTERLAAEKAKLCSEKIELEAVLESESEYIVNKLHAQVRKRWFGPHESMRKT